MNKIACLVAAGLLLSVEVRHSDGHIDDEPTSTSVKAPKQVDAKILFFVLVFSYNGLATNSRGAPSRCGFKG